MRISSKNQVLNSVLFSLDSKIEEMVNKIVSFENKKLAEKFQPLLSFYDIESIRTSLVYDLVRAIEKYTNNDDELKSINYAYVGGGTIEISASVIRDGAEFYLNTNLIEAGGYNIQCFHYRYITKTNLPKTGNSEVTDRIKIEMKRLAKIKTIKGQIIIFEAQIKQYQSIIQEYSMKSDDELMAASYFYNLTWNDMVARGADVNFKGGEIEFNKKREEDMVRQITSNRNHIQLLMRYKLDAFKSIEKCHDKIHLLK